MLIEFAAWPIRVARWELLFVLVYQCNMDFCKYNLSTKVETIEWMEFAIKCLRGASSTVNVGIVLGA
jgi:hypothetical protein